VIEGAAARRVVLVVPPAMPGRWPNREGAVGLGAVEPGDSGFRYPPHTVAAVAGVLCEEGYEVEAFDAVAMDWGVSESVQQVLAGVPDLVAVNVSFATRSADERFVSALRAATNKPIVAFGSSTSHMSPIVGVDYWLQGEPEWALPALLARLAVERLELGIVTAESLGLPRFTQSLDDLPMPSWDLLPLERYSLLSVLSSRGCNLGCSWCPYTVAQGHAFRAYSPERTAAELAHIVERYGPKRIVFRDPAFALDRKRVLAICKGIRQEPRLAPGRNLIWECESHPSHFDRRMLRQMNLAGCVGIKVGLETVSESVLDTEGRLPVGVSPRAYLDHVADLCQVSARLGIACRLYVMVGLPGQQLDDVRRMAEYVRRIAPASMTAKRLKRYPGLKLSQHVLPSESQIDQMEKVLSDARSGLAIASRPASSAIWRLRRKLDQVMGTGPRGGIG